VFAIVGLVALLVAFGVLAATAVKVMTGSSSVAVAPSDSSTAVTLAPAPAEPEDTAGPGVRMIAPDAATAAASATTSEGTAAATQTAALPPAVTAPADSPLPRLRPSMSANSGVAGEATLPAPTAGTALPPPAANLAPPVSTAPVQQGDDVTALMSDVDRILQQHRTVAPPAAVAPMATGVGAPMPVTGGMGAADTGAQTAMGSPAPLDIVAPPAPAPKRRGWFLFPDRDASGLPIPPADIPDPEGAAGQ
jgi:hypothetical protein